MKTLILPLFLLAGWFCSASTVDYLYDANGQLVLVQIGEQGAYSYGYDPVGNRVFSATTNGSWASSLRVEPASADYGEVQTGASAVRTFSISNAGPAVITGTILTESPFIPAPDRFSLEPGAVGQVTVEFAPEATGAYSGQLVFLTDSGSCTCSVTGASVELSAPASLYVSASAAEGGTGANWDSAFRSVQEAVNAAVPGSTILVADGVYAEGWGETPQSSLRSRLVVTNAITIQSVNGPEWTVILGEDADALTGPMRCAFLANGAVLSGFTLSGGCTMESGDKAFDRSGGGAYANGATLTNCVLVGNYASAFGGGCAFGTLIDCRLENNAAARGGGAEGAVLSYCRLTGNAASESGGGAEWCQVENSLFENNLAFMDGGGAEACMLSGCILSNNAAVWFGGGASFSELTDCRMALNQAQGGGGASDSLLGDCVLDGNLASECGGGAFNSDLVGGTVTGNQAQEGGGASGCLVEETMFLENGAGSGGGAFASELVRCRLAGNFADEGGGVMKSLVRNSALVNNLANAAGGASGCILTNCTVRGNTALVEAGGALQCEGVNTILYENTAPFEPNYEACSLSFCCAMPLPDGDGNIEDDPLLVAGWRLASNSPCVGLGSAVAASGTDLDGEAWQTPPCIGCDQVDPVLPPEGPLTVAILADGLYAPPGYEVGFSAQVEGTPSGSSWSFGDGCTGQGPAVRHAWDETGTYEVTLAAWNGGPAGSVSATVTVHIVTSMVCYARADSQTPVSPYTNWATATAVLQDAVDVCPPIVGRVIASNGTYSVGGARTVGGFLSNRIRVNKPILITSLNGAAATVVSGEGRDRCAFLSSGAILNGFTLVGGVSEGMSDLDRSGAGAYAVGAVISNCVIRGSAAAGDGGGVYGGQLVNCLLAGNRAEGYGGGAADAVLTNCTVTGNRAVTAGGGASGCVVANNIVYFNTSLEYPNIRSGTASYTCASPIPEGEGNTALAPRFAGLNDYHLAAGSPGVDAGAYAEWMDGAVDLAGNPRLDGPVDMGAYEGQCGNQAKPAICGFGGDGTGWTFTQGGNFDARAGIRDNILTITPLRNDVANAAFYNQPQPVRDWVAEFNWTVGTDEAIIADGFALVLQRNGLSNVGGGGGNLGYEGSAFSDSVAIGLWNYTEGWQAPCLRLGVNGHWQDLIELSASGIDFRSNGCEVRFRICYSDSDATLQIDLQQGETVVHKQFMLGGTIETLIGGATAYVGFTGGNGGRHEEQQIADFSFRWSLSGLLAQWQAEGDALDSTGLHDGALGEGATYGSGYIGQAFLFNGVTGVMHGGNWSPGTRWSVEAWVNPSALPVGRRLIAGGTDGARDWGLVLQDGIFAVLYRNTAGEVCTSTAPDAAFSHAWSHLAATCDGSTARLFVNGVLAASGAVDPDYAATGAGVQVGGDESGDPFCGSIDEVSVYDRALEQWEIIALYGAAGSVGRFGQYPAILKSPADIQVASGSPLVLDVDVAGALPLTLEWFKDGQPVQEGPGCTGMSSDRLRLASARPDDGGLYRVVVSNGFGVATSETAVVSILDTEAAPVPSGLIGWWRGEGNADDHLGLHNGIVEGNVQFVPGRVGQAFQFDGHSGIYVGAWSPGGAWTIEAWVKPSALSSTPPIIIAGGLAEYRDWALAMQDNAFGVVCQTGDESVQTFTDCRTATLGEWVHLAGTFDGEVVRLYVNSKLAVTGKAKVGYVATAQGVFIGNAWGGDDFTGCIDEVAVYDRALSAWEVQTIVAAGTAGKQESFLSISKQPADSEATVGQPLVVLEVEAAGHPQPLSYQWRRYGETLADGENVSGVASNCLVLHNLTVDAAGLYDVIVTAPGSCVTSRTARLDVLQAPIFAVSPASLRLPESGRLVFHAEALWESLPLLTDGCGMAHAWRARRVARWILTPRPPRGATVLRLWLRTCSGRPPAVPRSGCRTFCMSTPAARPRSLPMRTGRRLQRPSRMRSTSPFPDAWSWSPMASMRSEAMPSGTGWATGFCWPSPWRSGV